jgi:hypothetical protein
MASTAPLILHRLFLRRAAAGCQERDRRGLTAPGRRRMSPAMTSAPAQPDSPNLEDVILALCAEAGPGRSINPTDAAVAYAAARGEDALAWRGHLSGVRAAAVRLAEAGRLVIFRKGKPADPRDFRGVYRLGAPRVE